MSSPSLCLSGSREMQSTPLAVALMRRWFGLATQEPLLLQDEEETWARNLPDMQTRTTAEALMGESIVMEKSPNLLIGAGCEVGRVVYGGCAKGLILGKTKQQEQEKLESEKVKTHR